MAPSAELDAIARFSDLVECERRLERMKWPDGVFCPRCQKKEIGWLERARRFQCKYCRYQFTHKVGTIFQDSPLLLTKWFVVLWNVWTSAGISDARLAKALGITQKTAWFMRLRIESEFPDPYYDYGSLLEKR